MPLIARLAVPAALAGLLALVPATLLGHVEMIDSSPEAGSSLESPPAEVIITFGEELDPQASTFTVSDAEGHVVGNGEVDLTVADRNVLRGDVEITEPGVYTVGYTVTGLDGHEIGGAFSFGFDTDEEIPEPPDTALPAPLPAPGNPLPSVLGAALLLSAVAVLRRRLALAALLVVILALGATACVPSEQLPATCQQESVSLTATLDGDRLDPAAFDVCQDQQVTLAIAIERDGVLHLHGYDDQVQAREVRAGEQVSLEFQATHPGQFPIALHTLEDSEELTVGSLTVHVP
jgi:methionine-rich copper-binding protein CopC